MLLALVWFGWAFAASFGLRYCLKRWVFRFEPEWAAYLSCYAAMLALALTAAWFVDFSGWNFKGGNYLLIQQTAEFVLILSPVGLPLQFGGPAVVVYDLVREWRLSEEITR